MELATQGQVTKSAAEVYEEFFVPALFGEWAPRVAEIAAIGEGHAVLDVGCGTGVLASEASKRCGPRGRVVGLDCNEGMLAEARRKRAGVEWRQAFAEELPFADNSFERVVSQFAVMFFKDRIKALGEMWRVLKPGGLLAVAVWDRIDNSPGYAAMAGLLHRLFGEAIAAELHAPFVLGDTKSLVKLFRQAGIDAVAIETLMGSARFPSLDSWVYTDIKGWTLADRLDGAQYAALLQAAKRDLKGFVQEGGRVETPIPAHVVTAVKA